MYLASLTEKSVMTIKGFRTHEAREAYMTKHNLCCTGTADISRWEAACGSIGVGTYDLIDGAWTFRRNRFSTVNA